MLKIILFISLFKYNLQQIKNILIQCLAILLKYCSTTLYFFVKGSQNRKKILVLILILYFIYTTG